MTEASWPSPNYNSRNVTDGEYERLAARFSDDGVDGSPLDAAVVAAGTGLQVTVRADVWASVRGHAWTSGTTDVTLTVGANSSGSTRTDRVVLRLDRSTWDVAAVVLPGTAGSGAPALTQDPGNNGVWEIPLARLTVPNGATSVTVTREEQYIGSRVRPCTSSTRPLFPRRGDPIQEVDTGRMYTWGGSVWELLHGDTGELALSPGFSTWSFLGDNVGEKIGHTVSLRISVTRQGSTFYTSDSSGSKMAVVPDQLKPKRNEYFEGRFTGAGSGSCRVVVRTDGEIWAEYPTENVSPGHTLNLTMNYFGKES